MNFIVVFFFLSFTGAALAQSVFPYEEIRLEKPADYKTAEPMALSAASFLLSTAFDRKDVNRQRAFTFLVKWSAGDNGYDLSLHGAISEMLDDRDLMSLFVAAMAKFCVENKALGTNTRVIEKGAIKMVLDYADNPANNFTINKKRRKRLELN